MQISSSTTLGGAQSLQMLKAQQAWEARRAAKTQTPTEAPQVIQPAPQLLDEAVPNTPSGPAHLSPQWNRTVQEIQTIAGRAGFVGLSEQDIRRAYTYGESLLADYRV